jgi:hypothetical protein
MEQERGGAIELDGPPAGYILKWVRNLGDTFSTSIMVFIYMSYTTTLSVIQKTRKD